MIRLWGSGTGTTGQDFPFFGKSCQSKAVLLEPRPDIPMALKSLGELVLPCECWQGPKDFLVSMIPFYYYFFPLECVQRGAGFVIMGCKAPSWPLPQFLEQIYGAVLKVLHLI